MQSRSLCGAWERHSMIKHFGGSLLFTAIGLVLGGWYGWALTGTIDGVLSMVWICAVLAVLEISLSFDNAAVNASVLKDMDPVWQQRFLTWGIIIAVFGMRVIFPLLIVVIAAKIGPWQAMVLAASQPEEYARIMHEAHLPIAAFGGAGSEPASLDGLIARLERDEFDLVAVGHALLADPEWVLKIRDGRLGEKAHA